VNVTWPVVARTQGLAPLIGWLSSTAPDGYEEFVAAFRKSLKEASKRSVQEFRIEFRWALKVSNNLMVLALGCG